MFSLFARPKPCRIMIALKNSNTTWHLSRIARETETTYVYVTKLVSKLEQGGFVMVEPKGKKRIVKLTEKGAMVANNIDELMKRFEQ